MARRRGDDQEGLSNINKRAERQQKSYLNSFATNGVNPLNEDNFTVRNTKVLAYMAVEIIHTTFFHLIETVKVRA